MTGPISDSHPLSFLRRGVERVTAPDRADSYKFEDSRSMSRRGFLQTTGALMTIAAVEQMFKFAEANDTVPGEHNFTPENVAKLGVNSTEKMLDLAEKHGYLPTETANSDYRYAKFEKIADRASLQHLRQYFRAMEMLRNDGFFDDDKADVQRIVTNTPDIAPVRYMLLGTLGARAKDGSEVVHGLTRGEVFYVLEDYLPNNFKFPYQNDQTATSQYKKFVQGVNRIGDTSLINRGVADRSAAIHAANKRK